VRLPTRPAPLAPPTTAEFVSVELEGITITRGGLVARDGRFRIDEDIHECRYERVEPSRAVAWVTLALGAATAACGVLVHFGVALVGLVLLIVGGVTFGRGRRRARFRVWARTERGARVQLTDTPDEQAARALCFHVERYHALRSSGMSR
jgi:hypothetical protein